MILFLSCNQVETVRWLQDNRIIGDKDNEAVAESRVILSVLWVYGDEAREREMVCLRLDRLPFWMGTI
jgi:hypothetical protein